ncbi:hypothetical protein cypCar_00033831 [Cyprinus carpio]|nr:hypothetical protein cypCar_00033831 [Cyprinus carpio]
MAPPAATPPWATILAGLWVSICSPTPGSSLHPLHLGHMDYAPCPFSAPHPPLEPPTLPPLDYFCRCITAGKQDFVSVSNKCSDEQSEHSTRSISTGELELRDRSKQRDLEDTGAPSCYPSIPNADLAAHMPIEFVCKIKFAEEDEKQKGNQDGDKESLIEESCSPPAKDLAGFASACSLHGINHIFVSGRLGVRQTLWALAFLVSLALFLYQAAKCAISYLEHPHITALNEEATPEMMFPAVTICNINRFRFSALTDADIYHLANLTGLPPKNKDGHKPTDLEYPAPDMQDIFNRTGHQLQEMLKNCNFSGQNCSAEDFTVVSSRKVSDFGLQTFASKS